MVDNPAAKTPVAMNLGIAAASYDIVVRVDGHGELTDGYIERAVELLAETGAANVGGVMDAQGETPFEEAVAVAYTTKLGLGGSTFHLAESPAGEAETVFLGVFRKAALTDVGGFDESMHRAQDWELNYRLRQAGHRIWFSPDLQVTYRPAAVAAGPDQADVRDRQVAPRGRPPLSGDRERALSGPAGRRGGDRRRLGARTARRRPGLTDAAAGLGRPGRLCQR